MKNILYIAIGIVLVGGGIWFFFLRSTPEPAITTAPLGTADTRTTVGVSDQTSTPSNSTQTNSTVAPTQKVFKIADGPVSSAVFIEAKNPTTTLARYVLSNNGHVQDLAIDIPGAIAKSISNTTIPGIMQSQWAPQGSVVVLQYLNSTAVKTVSVTLPEQQATSSENNPIRIQFFPDGISDVAISPDGKQAAYLLRTQKGVDGYIGNVDGSAGKKVFSIPLSQIVLSWPTQTTLLAQSPSVNSAPGIVFSVDVKTGNVVPLLQATGLIAVADPTYAYLAYQSTSVNTTRHITYLHNLKTRVESQLSFNPIVEKCTWRMSKIPYTLFCASPIVPTPENYVDLWHMGATSIADSIFSYNLVSGVSAAVVTPGGNQGGEDSDIVSMSVSPNGKYLLFIKKGDRSLWGVRLSQ